MTMTDHRAQDVQTLLVNIGALGPAAVSTNQVSPLLNGG
jgi:hypothetical protein